MRLPEVIVEPMVEKKTTQGPPKGRGDVRVSLILATKDRASFLKTALENIRQFKGPRDELIIIDGGSTDSTMDEIASVGNLVDIVITEPDDGEAHAFNKGVLLANGQFIKLLTDDDFVHPDAFEQAVQLFEQNADLDMLMCGGEKIRGNKRTVLYVPPDQKYGNDLESILKFGACGVGLFIKRSALAKTGLLNPRAVSVDLDYLANAVFNGAKISFARINLYEHVIHDHSGASARKDSLENDIKHIRRKYLGFKKYYELEARYRVRQTTNLVGNVIPGARSVKRRLVKSQAVDKQPVWDCGLS